MVTKKQFDILESKVKENHEDMFRIVHNLEGIVNYLVQLSDILLALTQKVNAIEERLNKE